MGGGQDAPDRFGLTVPARADLVVTLRVFVSAVARHYALADDLVEDLKLAVSEACTDPIEAGVGGELAMAIAGRPDGVRCEITSRRWSAGASAAAADLPEGIDPNVLDRLQVVRALFADAERTVHDGDVIVRFSTASRTAS